MTLSRYFRFTRGASYHHSVNLNYAKWRHGPPKHRLWSTSGPWSTGWEPLIYCFDCVSASLELIHWGKVKKTVTSSICDSPCVSHKTTFVWCVCECDVIIPGPLFWSRPWLCPPGWGKHEADVLVWSHKHATSTADYFCFSVDSQTFPASIVMCFLSQRSPQTFSSQCCSADLWFSHRETLHFRSETSQRQRQRQFAVVAERRSQTSI